MAARAGGSSRSRSGKRDVSDRLQIPQKLYGREARDRPRCSRPSTAWSPTGRRSWCWSRATPASARARWSTSSAQADRPRAGLLRSGKFDQYKRDIPYATLAQAFRGWCARSSARASGSRPGGSAARGPRAQRPADRRPDPRARARHRAAAAGPGAAAERGAEPVPPGVPAASSGSSPRPSTRWCSSSTTCSGRTRPRLALLERSGRPTPTCVTCSSSAPTATTRSTPTHPLMRTLERSAGRAASCSEIVLGPLSQDDLGRSSRHASLPAREGQRRLPSWFTRRPKAIPSSPSSS